MWAYINVCPSGYSTACAPGFFAYGGAVACSPCPEGSYCPSAIEGPTLCPLGKYSEARSTNCTTCEAGLRCPEAPGSLCFGYEDSRVLVHGPEAKFSEIGTTRRDKGLYVFLDRSMYVDNKMR